MSSSRTLTSKFCSVSKHIASQRISLARNPLVMKIITFRCFLIAIAIVLAFTFVHPTLAHTGRPRLEISVERMNPGGVLDVRGVEFDYEQSVTLYLERKGIVVPLGEVVTDLEGVFIYVAILPVDLPQGVYNIRAVTGHHDVLSPALTVQGSPILGEGGGQGERDEDDGLLAPMPTFAPGVSSTPLPQTTALEPPVSKGSSTILIYSILLGMGIVALLGIRRLKKQ